MKRFLALSAFSVLTSAALAADLPARSTPVAPAAPVASGASWTGCSVRVSTSYGWQKSATPLAAGVYDGGSHTGDGGAVGGGFGCDFQHQTFVIGAQGSVEWARIKGVNAFYPVLPAPLPEFTTSNASSLGSLTVRAGFLAHPAVLLYVKGGVAWIRNEHLDYDTGADGPTFIGRAKATRHGWTLGAGAEYAITRNWFAFAEYNYADFGAKDQTLTGVVYIPGADDPGAVQIPMNWSNRYDNKLQAVTLGVRYKFN